MYVSCSFQIEMKTCQHTHTFVFTVVQTPQRWQGFMFPWRPTRKRRAWRHDSRSLKWVAKVMINFLQQRRTYALHMYAVYLSRCYFCFINGPLQFDCSRANGANGANRANKALCVSGRGTVQVQRRGYPRPWLLTRRVAPKCLKMKTGNVHPLQAMHWRMRLLLHIPITTIMRLIQTYTVIFIA